MRCRQPEEWCAGCLRSQIWAENLAMDTNTIVRLLRPFIDLGVDPRFQAVPGQTLTYMELLLKWNAKVNLTAVRKAEEIVTRHFGESFFAAERLVPAGWRGAVIDVGSGAGFPGLPLAMLAPQAEVTLIEANNKKAAFLSEVIFALKLSNVKVFKQRAEDYRGQGDLVTMRAVEKFERSLGVASKLVREGGRLALMIGSSQVDLAKHLAPELAWQEPVAVPGGHSRVVLVGTKAVKVGD